MRIIISPAKKMRVDTDSFACGELPVFLDRTETLMNWIRGLSYKEQKKAVGLQRQDRTGECRTFCGNGSAEKSHARDHCL